MKLSLIREAGSRRDLFRKLMGKGNKPEPKPENTPEVDGPQLPDTDMNRRGFLKTAGTAAASATGHGQLFGTVAGLADSNAANIYSKMTDAELLDTPEHKWLDQIPANRAAYIARKHPEHGKREALAKLMKIVSYGFLKNQGVDRSTAKAMSKHAEEMVRNAQIRSETVIKNAEHALKAIGSKWKIPDGATLMQSAYKDGYFGVPRDPNAMGDAEKFAEVLEKRGHEFGIKADPNLRQVAKKLDKNLATKERDYQHSWRKRQENSRSLKQDDEQGRWADDGGRAFESKLDSILGLL
jgi:hypothetical protein